MKVFTLIVKPLSGMWRKLWQPIEENEDCTWHLVVALVLGALGAVMICTIAIGVNYAIEQKPKPEAVLLLSSTRAPDGEYICSKEYCKNTLTGKIYRERK